MLNTYVEREISEAPYYDMNSVQIKPGHVVGIVGLGYEFMNQITVKNDQLYFGDMPLDDVMEYTDQLLIIGTVQ